MGTDINLVKGLLSCLELNGIFLLELQSPGKGLPEGASLNHYSPTVPTTVPSNLPHTHTHYYIIHQLKMFLNTRVNVHLRTIYLLPTISLTILTHGSSHMFHLNLLLLLLSSWPFTILFRVLYYHTLVRIISQTIILSMLSLYRQKIGSLRLKIIINQLYTLMSMTICMFWNIFASTWRDRLHENLILGHILFFGTSLLFLTSLKRI